MSAQAMLREVRKIRVEVGSVPYGRHVDIQVDESGRGDSLPGEISVTKDGRMAWLSVPCAFVDDPVRGLDDRHRAWLRPGDHIIVDSSMMNETPSSWGKAGLTGYDFIWPDDPGPPRPVRRWSDTGYMYHVFIWPGDPEPPGLSESPKASEPSESLKVSERSKSDERDTRLPSTDHMGDRRPGRQGVDGPIEPASHRLYGANHDRRRAICAGCEHRDRCRATITGNRSVLTAARGQLAVEVLEDTVLSDGCDLCERCAAGFLDWLRSGNPDLAAVDGPGAAIADTAVASMTMA